MAQTDTIAARPFLLSEDDARVLIAHLGMVAAMRNNDSNVFDSACRVLEEMAGAAITALAVRLVHFRADFH